MTATSIVVVVVDHSHIVYRGGTSGHLTGACGGGAYINC